MESAVSNDFSANRAPRVLFFGMQGSFSSPSLLSLLESGIEVCAVIVPASPLPGTRAAPMRLLEPPPGRLLPLAHAAPSILRIAWRREIPVWEIAYMKDAQVLSTLQGYEPDIACVACFSARIPSAVLALPRLGCLNVHPSLLPANRGPVPLFWTLREGDEETGVTIHLMEEKMDSGAILAQERFSVSDGIRYEELEVECAQRGGRLLARTTRELFEGRARPVPQDEARSSYHSFPDQTDLVVYPQEWKARRLFNFIQGVSIWNGPVELCMPDRKLFVYDAVSYIANGHDQVFQDTRMNHELDVRCKDGYVRVLLN